MDHYDPETVFSSIDRMGRYCYGNQPGIAQWNLSRLAETLLPLIDDDSERAVSSAREVINAFASQYERYWLQGMRAKLGLASEEAGDLDLAKEFLAAMEGRRIDWTLAFRALAAAASGQEQAIRTLFANAPAFDSWNARWQERLSRETVSPSARAQAMCRVNPRFIPRNHRVEEALKAAVEQADYDPFERLLKILASPFDDQPESAAFAEPAPEGQGCYRTFCGT
jgi:uncharacterized protein YdiU (UPF0061 family)